MGRQKQRASKDTNAPASTLEPAFSSSPTRPPRYSLYCTNHENERRWHVNTYACYAARKIIAALIGDDPSPTRHKGISFVEKPTISSGEIDISSDELDEIMAHKYTPSEEAWELPSPYPNEISQFITGRRMSNVIPDDAPPMAPVAPVVPKIVPPERDGKITIAQLCDELKMEARDARAALRKAKLEKPAGGWLFTPERADEIRALLRKGA